MFLSGFSILTYPRSPKRGDCKIWSISFIPREREKYYKILQKVAYWIISFAEVTPVINSRKKSKSHTICISWMKVVVGTDRLVSMSQKDTKILNMVALLDSFFLNWSNCTLEKPPWPTKTSNTMHLPKKTVKPKPGVSLNIMKPTLSTNKDRSGNKKRPDATKGSGLWWPRFISISSIERIGLGVFAIIHSWEPHLNIAQ